MGRLLLIEINERSTSVEIGGVTYPLVLTTRATKEICRKYGGINNLGDQLMQNENWDKALDELVWLICLLANQAILIGNLTSKTKKEQLSPDIIELLTTPVELTDFREAIMSAITKGVKRNIESEEDETPKNEQPE